MACKINKWREKNKIKKIITHIVVRITHKLACHQSRSSRKSTGFFFYRALWLLSVVVSKEQKQYLSYKFILIGKIKRFCCFIKVFIFMYETSKHRYQIEKYILLPSIMFRVILNAFFICVILAACFAELNH